MKRLGVVLAFVLLLTWACSFAGSATETPTRVPLVSTQAGVAQATPNATLPPIGPKATLPPIDTRAIQPTEPSETTGILFQDDFSDPGSGWDRSSTDNGSTDYGQSDYVIHVDTKQYSVWANPGRSFDDVAVEVDAWPTAGPDINEMGIICRYQDNQNFIYATISSDGYYGILALKDGNITTLTGDGQLQPSDAIKQGTATNHIELICRGDQYALVVNGQPVDSVDDTSFTGGDVGLLAGTFETGGVEVHFDNFVVRQAAGALPAVSTPTSKLTSSLFQDNFSDPTSGWDAGSTANGTIGYADGVYAIHVKTPNYSKWGTPSQSFGDVSIQVEAEPTAATPDSFTGVICRYQDADNFMNALISSDGYYAIRRFKDGDSLFLTGDGKWAVTDAIQQGRAVNHITFVCQGGLYSLYVNDALVDLVTDSSFSEGDIGLMAGSFDEGDIEVHFDNLVVTAPQ